MIRNLIAAEPSPAPELDALMDSARPEKFRGALPTIERLTEFRHTVAERVHARINDIAAGHVGTPAQLTVVATHLLAALINHEYQHDPSGSAKFARTTSATPSPLTRTPARSPASTVTSSTTPRMNPEATGTTRPRRGPWSRFERRWILHSQEDRPPGHHLPLWARHWTSSTIERRRPGPAPARTR